MPRDNIYRALGIKKSRAEELRRITSIMFVEANTADELIMKIYKSKKLKSIEKVYACYLYGFEIGTRNAQALLIEEDEEEETEPPLFLSQPYVQ